MAKAKTTAPLEQVWRVITDYDNLADVVPDLIVCQRLPSRSPQRIRLRQRAGHSSEYLRVEAEGILEVEEVVLTNNVKELRFNMVKGDFKEFYGRFLLENDNNAGCSVLSYDVVTVLRNEIPEHLFDYAVESWLPINIQALLKQADKVKQGDRDVNNFNINPRTSIGKQTLKNAAEQHLPWKKPPKRASIVPTLYEGVPSDYLGTTSVPLPPVKPQNSTLDTSKSMEDNKPTVKLENGYSAFSFSSQKTTMNEIHLRKLDSAKSIHRRIVARIAINATIKDVWRVITDYDHLSDFIPDLEVSEIVEHPKSAPPGYRCVRQVVSKTQFYITVRVESYLDIIEKPYREIQFRQSRGMIDTLQGKWILSPEDDESGSQTILKYAVEVKVPSNMLPMILAEPAIERCVIEAIPANLVAIKNRVESIIAQRQLEEFRMSRDTKRPDAFERQLERPRLSLLLDDFSIFKGELERQYGGDGGYLPTRSDLRRDNRSDIEKAITAHGGPVKVAERIGWKLKTKRRKPRGYWDDIGNIRREITDFIFENNLSPTVMPRKIDLTKAGRHDLRRAIEKRGGIYELATDLGLEPPTGSRLLDQTRLEEDPLSVSQTATLRVAEKKITELERNGYMKMLDLDDDVALPLYDSLNDKVSNATEEPVQKKMNLDWKDVDLFDLKF